MRHTALIAAALLASCAVFNAHAADASSDPCSLLDWQDFKSAGAVKDTPSVNAGWVQVDSPKEIPDSHLWLNMCSYKIKSQAEDSYVVLRFDSFNGKVTKTQVGDWLKSVAAADAAKPDVTIVRIGDATCEKGQYDLPIRKDDGSEGNRVVHYSACDQQVDTQHISLNVHVPESRKGALPSPEQTKALLDKSIARMKQQAFAPPGQRSL